MSLLKVNALIHPSGISNNVTFDASGNISVSGNSSISGTLTVTGNTSVSGTFTRPNNPAFMAGIAATTNATYTANPYAFVFNTTAYNVGSNYNTSNGRFTAPVAGVYLFGFSIYVGSNAYAQFCFRKNGSDINFTSGDAYAVCEYPASIADHGFTHSAALLLAAGDYVTVGVRSGSSGTFYQGHTYFWGYLVG